MRIINIVPALLLLLSCRDHFGIQEVCGRYTPVGYRNNFDTLQLQAGGVYHRSVYDINRKLLLEMNGKWTLTNGNRVVLSNFYLNLDDDLVRFPELVKDTGTEVLTYLEMNNGSIRFCGMGNHPGENCFRKVE